MKQELKQMLAELTAITGLAGQEQEVVRHLVELLTPLADQVEVDAFGNIFAVKRGQRPGPRLMIAAHSDEIGAMVKSVEANGFIRFHKVGGTLDPLLLGRKVLVNGHVGIIGVKAGHMQTPEERTRVVAANDLYIDVGVESAEAVAALGIKVGDPIVYVAELNSLGGNPDRVFGKAVDDRIGCAVLVKLLASLQEVEFAGEIHAVITVQEEVGLRGATVATHRVNPDLAIALDTVPAGDTPDINTNKELPIRIGKGPVIQVLSGGGPRGFLLNPSVKKFLVEMAQQARVPYQLAVFSGGNTDASAMHLVRDGILSAAITIPRRYSHSPVEMLDLNDAVHTLQLLRQICLNLSAINDLSFI
ncbi:MAG: M42 family metallopeptidase [Firmicutes bacterium]|nr:M42 family metallopeptidase [Bacillota bacterium]